MAVSTDRLVVLDPTEFPIARHGERAARPTSLAGKRIGFLDNSKQNSDKILQHLEQLLRERYDIGPALHRRKPTASRVVPDAILQEMARECDLVIAAVGD